MRVTSCTSLDEHTQWDIRTLITACNHSDGTYNELYLSNRFNAYPEMDAFFLLWDGERLVGVLDLEAADTVCAEVSAYVLPEARGRGGFRTLIAAACRELERFRYSRLLFQTEQAFPDRMAIVAWLGATFEEAEELMLCHPPRRRRTPAPDVRPGVPEDFTALRALHTAAFGTSPDVAARYIGQSLRSRTTDLLVAEVDGQIAGCGCMDHSGERPLIFGMCVAPSFRRQGVGRRLMQTLLAGTSRWAPPDMPTALYVSPQNEPARALYRSCGFETVSIYEYYAVPLAGLRNV